MGEMVQSGSQYTDDQRLQAVSLYAIYGTQAKVAEDMAVPPTTVSSWAKSEWWQSALAQLRAENADKHIAQYSRLTEKALEAAERGIDDLAGKELTASDIKSLAVTGATATDKARLLMNQPTSIKGDNSSIQALADQFAKLSEQWQEKQANVIATVSQTDK